MTRIQIFVILLVALVVAGCGGGKKYGGSPQTLPTVSGSPTQGATLTSTHGIYTTPDGSTSITYQWQDCNTSGNNCSNISGATTSTYTLTSNDVDDVVRVMVTATSGDYVESLYSGDTAIIASSGPPSYYSIFAPSTDPTSGNIDSGDPESVNVGVEFTASSSGTVAGVAFYKSTANTGTHIGDLWSSTGTLIASVTFTGETSTGWQYAYFSSPVSVTSGTTYVASYYAPAGHYSGTDNGLNGAVTTGPLTALSGGGVYTYAGSPAFPTSTFSESNYWVDVLFLPQLTTPVNTSAPTISGAAVQNNVLTANPGTWTGPPNTYTYQWQDCNSSGADCSSISGATSSTYTPQSPDVGDTLVVSVTGKNADGSATAFSGSTSTVVAGGSLPPGVTLDPIDGGPNYYCSGGFSYACSDGWDNSSFYPIGVWYASITDSGDATFYKSLGLNTAFRTTSNSSLSSMNSAGIDAIVSDQGSPETSGMGSETTGLLAQDEPDSWTGGTYPLEPSLADTPNSQQDGRFWYVNNTWNFLAYGGLSGLSGGSAAVLNTKVGTPNGSQRHVDIQSTDIYWFSLGKGGIQGSEGEILYGLGSAMTTAEAECGCRYGDMIDTERSDQTTYPAPIFQLIENGGPLDQQTTEAQYITPPEMNWAVWSSIIHGARGLIWFNNTFGGPGDSGNDIADSYFQDVQSGNSVSITGQMTTTDDEVESLASAINSPQMLNYVTVSPTDTTFGGIETRATDDGGNYYIFSDTRDAESTTGISATFTVAGSYSGPVTVVGENRTVTATDGVFSDTFANASTVHIYEIPS